MPSVDLNSDLGEGLGLWKMGDDTELLGIVSSANVACGFHAGDPSTMRRVCNAAAERGVTIGAHVAYPDLAGFGRRFIDIDPHELSDAVTYQLGALDAFARSAGTAVAYVKPHGALYNTVVHHHAQAAAVVAGVAAFAPLPLLGLGGSAVFAHAEREGLRCVEEAFADRAYAIDGTLVPRQQPGAVLHDCDLIAERAVKMVASGVVTSIDGSELSVRVDSLCVHGDTPGAVEIARCVRRALLDAGIAVAPFVP